MVPNQWYAVLSSQEVPARRPVAVTRFGERLVLWRGDDGRVACLADLCPHRGAQLSGGALCGGELACPFHGFRFDSSGRCTLVPANGRAGAVPQALQVRARPVWEGHGLVFVWWGEAEPEPAAPPWFSDLEGDWAVSILQDHWRTHYSRAVENQLDVAHLPFVHHNTIGRGNRTVVDGPWVDWQGPNHFRLYMQNRPDDGTPARGADELKPPERAFWLDVLLPNLWQNHLGEHTRLVAAFAPVDEANTVFYVQFYQRRRNALAGIVAHLSKPLNRYILHQDRRVVETQRPLASSLRSGETLVPADRPIIEYRRWRAERLADAPPPLAATPGNE